MTNGLRHGSYLRYRQYCSRRLRRIRVGLGCTQSKREFKPQVLTPATVTDVRYLALVLVQSERCWAYAMQLKNDMTAETQRKRFHLLKRLTKAAQSAKLLVELCGARADTRTQLQAEAYSAWLSASVLFERNAHDKALALFLHAKEVYDKLGSIGGSSMQILCEERVANLQDSIRFSKYMLRHKAGASQEDDADDASLGELSAGGNELLAAKLETLRQEKLLQQAQSLDTVEWQGKTVPVSSEKLRMSFVEARNLKLQLDKALEAVNNAPTAAAASASASSSSSAPDAKDSSSSAEESTNLSSLFQRLFGCYDDALKVLRDALLEPKMLEAHKAHLLALQQYATAQRLEVQIQRNSNFVTGLVAQLAQQEAQPKLFAHRRRTKPDEAVVLYEKLLANLVELAEIAAANKNGAESRALALRCTATKALRVFFLAESYRRIKKYTESYLLYSRALEIADEFDKLAAKDKSAETAAVAADRARLATLKREALNLRGQVHAQALLASAEASAKVAQQQQQAAAQNVKIGGDGGAALVVSVAPPALTLATRLDQYEAGEVGAQYALLDFPPSFQSAPAKPILFDLAFNAIQYPDISARIAAKKPAAAAAAAAAAAPVPAAKQQQAPAQKAPAAAASAAAPAKQQQKKQPEPEPEAESEEEEEEEESEEDSPAPASKPAKAAAAPAAKKVIAPPGESKADRAAREKREKEEAEKARLKAEADAAKKGGWGLGGLVGKMFGR